MKKILFSACLLFLMQTSKAQITLEHTYTYNSSAPLMNLTILNSKEYWWAFDVPARTIYIHNLDHSLYKAIQVKNFNPPNVVNNYEAVFYLSADLFDCDNTNIEYMLRHPILGDKIMREDSTILWKQEAPNFPPLKIVNTKAGTKMVVNPDGESCDVYSLCGKLTGDESEIKKLNNSAGSSLGAFPNPSSSVTHITYKLPENTETADLIFYNLEGKEMKKMVVSKHFEDVLISTENLPAGTYLYTLGVKNQVLETKKIIVQ